MVNDRAQNMTFQGASPRRIGETKSSLRDVLSIMFRHQRALVYFAITVIALALLVTFFLPQVFESQARLLIKVGRESVSIDPTVSGPTMTLNQDLNNVVRSELAVLQSQYIIDTVVDKYGPEYFIGSASTGGFKGLIKSMLTGMGLRVEIPPHEQAVKLISENFSVEAIKDSSVIRVGYQADDPKKAQQVLDSMLKAYLEYRFQIHRTQASPDFFQGQANALLDELHRKEKKLDDFRLEHNIASLDLQKESLLTQIGQLQSQIDEALSNMQSSKARITSLEQALKSQPPTIELSQVKGRVNPAVDSIKQRLIQMELREKVLASRYQDNYRPLIELRDQIQVARRALERERTTLTETTTGVDLNYQTYQRELELERANVEAFGARRDTLVSELEKRQQTLSDLVSQETRYQMLKMEVDTLAAQYPKYMDNLRQANFSAALDVDKISNISIVQPPTFSNKPIKPKKMLNIMLGVMMGLAGGIVFTFLLDYLDDSIKSVDDVERRLELPVLVSISEEEYYRDVGHGNRGAG